jgi:hypothetical protein
MSALRTLANDKITTLAELNAKYPLSARYGPNIATPKLAAGASIATMPDLFGQLGTSVESEFASAANLSASQISIQTDSVATMMAANAYLWPPGTVVAEGPQIGTPLTSSTPIILTVTP